jgi:hypothetical protein
MASGALGPETWFAAVTTTLKRAALRGSATIRLTECNWNQIVEPSARGGVILESAWEDLSLCLAHASAIGDGSLANNRSARLLHVVSSLARMFAELGLAAALAALLMVVPLFVELRRALILVIRPFLITGTYFFLLPWRGFVSSELWKLIFGVAPAGIVSLGLFERWLDPRVTWSLAGGVSLIVYGLTIGIGMAGLAIAFITLRAIAPSLKVILDIFRYIGSTTYREKIQLHLNSVIRGLSVDGGAPRLLLILSHSLGTVIALDSLLSSEEWGEDADHARLPHTTVLHALLPGTLLPGVNHGRSRRRRGPGEGIQVDQLLPSL